MSRIAISVSSSVICIYDYSGWANVMVCLLYELRIEQQYPDLDTILQHIYRKIVSLYSKNNVFKYVVRVEDRLL